MESNQLIKLIIELIKSDLTRKIEIALIMISAAIVAVGLILFLSFKAQ